jgi:formate/nitrite transporter FocA (FNT family)
MPTSSKPARELVKDPESPVSRLEEAQKVTELVAIGAHVVYEAVRLEGEDELERPAVALAWSGLAAGLSMGFSLLAEAALFSFLRDWPWAPLVSHLGYSVGFLVVILGRQQLYTENTLTVVLPLLLHKNLATLWKVLRLWTIVLSTNVVGTFLFALAVGRLHFLEPGLQQSVLDISQTHVGPGFWTVFLRAVFAGWLIALMVWMLPNARSSRVAIIVMITYLISLAHLSHVIAGSTNVFFLVVTGHLFLASFFTKFFFPTLLGNVFGGVSLVAALAHGQVVGGKK